MDCFAALAMTPVSDTTHTMTAAAYRPLPSPGRRETNSNRAMNALFVLHRRRQPQHEMSERRGDRLGWIVLPGLRLERHDAPALLDDRDAGKTVQRAAGAQIIDG